MQLLCFICCTCVHIKLYGDISRYVNRKNVPWQKLSQEPLPMLPSSFFQNIERGNEPRKENNMRVQTQATFTRTHTYTNINIQNCFDAKISLKPSFPCPFPPPSSFLPSTRCGLCDCEVGQENLWHGSSPG